MSYRFQSYKYGKWHYMLINSPESAVNYWGTQGRFDIGT